MIENTLTSDRNSLHSHTLLSFFTLGIVITWLASLPSLLLDLPFKPFQILAVRIVGVEG